MGEIKDNLFDLYSVYRQYKLLYEFYQQNRQIKTIGEIKSRIEYIKKNPQINQRNELGTLMWVLGEIDN